MIMITVSDGEDDVTESQRLISTMCQREKQKG